MRSAEEIIDIEFRRMLRVDGERAASDYYKAAHQELIDARVKAEKAAAREKHYCESCAAEIVHEGRGRIPKRCASCR